MGILDFLKNNTHLNNNIFNQANNKLKNVDLAEKVFLTLSVGGSYNNATEERKVKNILSQCKTRQDILLKIIELCGDISTPKERYLVAKAYAWSKANYRTQAIKYLELYLNNDIYEGAYKGHHHLLGNKNFSLDEERNIHLSEMYGYLGKAYEGEYLFDNALHFYTIQKELTPFWPSGYCSICQILIKQNKLDEALNFLLDAKQSQYYKPLKYTNLGKVHIDDTFKKVIDNKISEIQTKIEKGYIYRPRKK